MQNEAAFHSRLIIFYYHFLRSVLVFAGMSDKADPTTVSPEQSHVLVSENGQLPVTQDLFAQRVNEFMERGWRAVPNTLRTSLQPDGTFYAVIVLEKEAPAGNARHSARPATGGGFQRPQFRR